MFFIHASCRTGRATGEVDSASLQFHDEEKIESDEATLGPDFHGGEVDRSHHVPMRFQKRLPRSRAFASRCWFDTMSLQDVGNCRVADRVPHFSEFTLDPIDSPRLDSLWRTSQ